MESESQHSRRIHLNLHPTLPLCPLCFRSIEPVLEIDDDGIEISLKLVCKNLDCKWSQHFIINRKSKYLNCYTRFYSEMNLFPDGFKFSATEPKDDAATVDTFQLFPKTNK